jgi:hypothetical protein
MIIYPWHIWKEIIGVCLGAKPVKQEPRPERTLDEICHELNRIAATDDCLTDEGKAYSASYRTLSHHVDCCMKGCDGNCYGYQKK